MVPTDDCDACTPEWVVKRRPSALAFSALPFLLTFIIVAVAVSHKLFPLLSGRAQQKSHHDGALGESWRVPLRQRLRITSQKLASVTFSINIALSAVLVELILCEISNTVNAATRTLALRVTLPSLLFLLIIATPALEIHSVIAGAGWSFDGVHASRRTAWILEAVGMAAWLTGFWYLGRGLLGSYLHEETYMRDHSLSEGCLERIGIIGISLMASLAGFAAISSLWQTFGANNRFVNESDLARKQAGLDATNDMLLTKESRLRAIERKLFETPQESKGFMSRVVGSLRGNPDIQERNTLQLEIQGLQTMRTTLQNSMLSLQSRRQAQLRAHTAYGRLFNLFSYAFSIYCLYRIVATTFTTFRRFSSPNTSFANSDPINNFLAILAKHWDPSLDRVAWSRTISFLLSGVMLLASFNSVLQTFLLFARVLPGVLHHARANFALLISQISATYVISSALLLRSNLPNEMKSAISDALGAPLEPSFTERWFEGWFLAASAVTVLGLWLGKRVRGSGWDDDDDLGDADVEMGKMS